MGHRAHSSGSGRAARHSRFLEGRKDLVPADLMSVVHNGLAEMPLHRPAEIDDRALDALVHYLAPERHGKDRDGVPGTPPPGK
jgi:hypothetical protein